MSFPVFTASPYLDDEEHVLERLRALTNGSKDKVEVLKDSADLMQHLERELDRLLDDNKKLMEEYEKVAARNRQLLARTGAAAAFTSSMTRGAT